MAFGNYGLHFLFMSNRGALKTNDFSVEKNKLHIICMCYIVYLKYVCCSI